MRSRARKESRVSARTRFHIDNLLPVKEIVLIMLKGKIKSIPTHRDSILLWIKWKSWVHDHFLSSFLLKSYHSLDCSVNIANWSIYSRWLEIWLISWNEVWILFIDWSLFQSGTFINWFKAVFGWENFPSFWNVFCSWFHSKNKANLFWLLKMYS